MSIADATRHTQRCSHQLEDVRRCVGMGRRRERCTQARGKRSAAPSQPDPACRARAEERDHLWVEHARGQLGRARARAREQVKSARIAARRWRRDAQRLTCGCRRGGSGLRLRRAAAHRGGVRQLRGCRSASARCARRAASSNARRESAAWPAAASATSATRSNGPASTPSNKWWAASWASPLSAASVPTESEARRAVRAGARRTNGRATTHARNESAPLRRSARRC